MKFLIALGTRNLLRQWNFTLTQQIGRKRCVVTFWSCLPLRRLGITCKLYTCMNEPSSPRPVMPTLCEHLRLDSVIAREIGGCLWLGTLRLTLLQCGCWLGSTIWTSEIHLCACDHLNLTPFCLRILLFHKFIFVLCTFGVLYSTNRKQFAKKPTSINLCNHLFTPPLADSEQSLRCGCKRCRTTCVG
jgi:hypothetical protein